MSWIFRTTDIDFSINVWTTQQIITMKKMKMNVGKSISAVNMCFVCFSQRYLLQSDDNDDDGVDK